MDELQEYVSSLDRRLRKAEESMKETLQFTQMSAEHLDNVQGSLKNEFQALRVHIEQIELKLQEMIRRSRLVVSVFEDCVHNKEFSRVELAVNSFKGEEFVSRVEFERWLREEL